ncbi:MAG: hypothetical protein Q9195_001017 [Heterodermia aff. obscurata]
MFSHRKRPPQQPLHTTNHVPLAKLQSAVKRVQVLRKILSDHEADADERVYDDTMKLHDAAYVHFQKGLKDFLETPIYEEVPHSSNISDAQRLAVRKLHSVIVATRKWKSEMEEASLSGYFGGQSTITSAGDMNNRLVEVVDELVNALSNEDNVNGMLVLIGAPWSTIDINIVQEAHEYVYKEPSGPPSIISSVTDDADFSEPDIESFATNAMIMANARKAANAVQIPREESPEPAVENNEVEMTDAENDTLQMESLDDEHTDRSGSAVDGKGLEGEAGVSDEASDESGSNDGGGDDTVGRALRRLNLCKQQ